MVVIKFANGKEFLAESIDDAVKQCLASGHDPFKPVVIGFAPIEVVEEPIEQEVEVKPKSKAKK